jgi:hypothetical protein
MSGEGSEEDFPRPLAGDKTLAQLVRLISRTMPKDADKKCTGADAEKVAAYIYDAFYSKAAQARNKPPRIELARLTVRQYRNAVADLIGSFRTAGNWDDKRGLRGEYSTVRQRDGNQRTGAIRVIDRIDPTVQFDFGTSAPDPDPKKFPNPSRFSVRWTGSVLAPETGEYEFIVRTDHATRLWINDTKQPLIDAGVKSGNDTEYHGSIFLLGGRVYPLRLEFTKGQKGDPDNNKKGKKPPPAIKAFITLAWKQPNQAEEVVPQRHLTPNASSVTLAVPTPFPPDDRSMGYERGTSISKEWELATTDSAIGIAGYVVARLGELSGVKDDAADRGPRLREFCRKFAERAFRRPLTDEQKRLYIDRPFEGVSDLDMAVKRVVLLVLKSPRFLYREVGGGHDAYDVASRLSFGLWDSLPDAQLLQAAAAGRLATHEQVLAQAERMVSDTRAHAKLHEFFLQWLRIDRTPELSKDTARFPGFDRAAASDLRTSLELFLEDVLWGKDSDYRQLLLADYLYLNGRLARWYGSNLPADAPFQKVSFPFSDRSGILTHPYLMAIFAYTQSSSPIHRGVFLARNVLGRTLRPPPDAFAPLAADLHPQLTTRQRVELQTRPESCQSCHAMINPLGFTLEHFDAIGRYRNREKEQPIDAVGSYQTLTGEVVKFNGVRELATYLADNAEAHDAFVERLFHNLVKQPVRAYGPRKLSELRRSFADNQYNIRKLMVEIIAESALPPRKIPNF